MLGLGPKIPITKCTAFNSSKSEALGNTLFQQAGLCHHLIQNYNGNEILSISFFISKLRSQTIAFGNLWDDDKG